MSSSINCANRQNKLCEMKHDCTQQTRKRARSNAKLMHFVRLRCFEGELKSKISEAASWCQNGGNKRNLNTRTDSKIENNSYERVWCLSKTRQTPASTLTTTKTSFVCTHSSTHEPITSHVAHMIFVFVVCIHPGDAVGLLVLFSLALLTRGEVRMSLHLRERHAASGSCAPSVIPKDQSPFCVSPLQDCHWMCKLLQP